MVPLDYGSSGDLIADMWNAVERERKKAEKQAKFDAKKKLSASTPAQPATSKSKEKKAKAAEKTTEEIVPEYVEETPHGERKSI